MINNNIYFASHYYFEKSIVATLFNQIKLKTKKIAIELLDRYRKLPQGNFLLSKIWTLTLLFQMYSLIFRSYLKPNDYKTNLGYQ